MGVIHPKKNKEKIRELKKIKNYRFIRKSICENHIHTMLVLGDGRIVTGEPDGLIHVFDINNSDNVMTIDTKMSPQGIIALENNKLLVDENCECLIKIYSIFLSSYICKFVKEPKVYLEKVISLSNERFAFFQRLQSDIEIWNCKDTCELITILKVGNYPVYNIFHLKKKDKLFSYSSSMFIWNLKTYQCETIVKQNFLIIVNSGMAELSNNTLIIGAHQQILLIDLSSYEIKVINKKIKDGIFTAFLQINNDIILCGGISTLFAFSVKTKSFVEIKLQIQYFKIDNIYIIKDRVYAFNSDNIIFFGEKNNKYLHNIEKNFNIFIHSKVA